MLTETFSNVATSNNDDDDDVAILNLCEKNK